MNEILNVSASQPNLILPEYDSRSRTGTMQSEMAVPEMGIEPEVVDLALAFLGPPGKTLYQVSLMCLTYAGLLAYAQVFQQTLTAQLLPSAPPVFVIIIFGCIVVPLSCYDLTEQIFIQVSMFFLRFGMLGLLILGTVIAILIDPYDNDNIDVIVVDQVTNTQVYPYPYFSADIPTANYAGFGAMFSTALFSQLFQHSVPGLIRPLSQEDKAEAPQIFANAMITTASVYIVLGVTCVSYFGQAIKGSISLNFVGFSWGLNNPASSGNSETGGLGTVAGVASLVIVLFPALDTLSIFPLIANTLGNNLHSCFPESRKFVKNSLSGEGSSAGTVHRMTTIMWRLVASIPPIVISAFVTDISLSLQLAGICGIIVSLIIPSLLQRYSREKIHDMSSFLLTENPYSTSFSDNVYTNAVLVIAIISLAICMCQCMY
jgi:amino acid permease